MGFLIRNKVYVSVRTVKSGDETLVAELRKSPDNNLSRPSVCMVAKSKLREFASLGLSNSFRSMCPSRCKIYTDISWFRPHSLLTDNLRPQKCLSLLRIALDFGNIFLRFSRWGIDGISKLVPVMLGGPQRSLESVISCLFRRDGSWARDLRRIDDIICIIPLPLLLAFCFLAAFMF
jgi:hypothetical protein